uniref:Uncharacterized protein n=1 Tax=Avena sativa TaxID=4498 RepID=A0ACD6AJC9_AVESA
MTSKQETMIVEALQSGSNLFPSGKKKEEMEGTLDKNQEKKDHPEAETKDSTTLMLADCQTPFDASDMDTKNTLAPAETDAVDLHSEGASVGVISPKQDNAIVETLQTDDISGGSASHLPATLQSTDLNQPPGQKSSENSGSKLFASGKKTEETEETFDKKTNYKITSIQTNDDSNNIAVGRYSPPEDKKEDSCVHVVDGGDLVGSKQTPAEVRSTDGSDRVFNASSTHASKDANVVELVVSISDATSACEVKKDPESHVSVPVLVSAATNSGDDSKEAHSVPSTHSDREASMVEVGASRNADTSVCELRKGPESNISGGLSQAGLLELNLELTNQAQSSTQSSAENVEETNASYNIQTTSLVESERKSPGNSAHVTPEGMESAGPKIGTIQMPSPDEKSTEVHSSVQVEIVSAAEQASTKDDKEQKPVDVTLHKGVVPTKDDHTDLQTEGNNIVGMNGANQDSAETEAMQIDGIYKGSSGDLPASLQPEPADSNQPAEQDALENSAPISASPNEHEKLKETSSEAAGGNSNCNRTDDDSHAMNLVGYSPSEGSDEDDSVQVAEAGDLEGSKELALDVVFAIAGAAEPEPICENAVHVQKGSAEAAHPSTDEGSVQVSMAEPEAKKEGDAPTQKENVESAAIKPETVGTEADLSEEASVPTQKETLVTGPVAAVPDQVEHASTELLGEDLNLKPGEAKTEQLLQPSSSEDMTVTRELHSRTGAKTPSTEHACIDGTLDQKETDAAADESPVVVGEEVLNTEIAPDGKSPSV